MECGETFSAACVPHKPPMLRNFLAPTLYRHTILSPSVSSVPLLVQIVDEGSMPQRLSTPPIVFSVPLLAVALFCAEACPMGTRIHTSSRAAKSFHRLDDALEDCNVEVLIKIDLVYKLVLIYFSVRRAWRCRVGFYGDRSYSVC